MIEKYIELLKDLCLKLGLSEGLSTGIAETIATLSLILVSIGLYFLVKYILKKTLYAIVQRSTNKYDDLLIKNKVIGRVCLLVPALLISSLLPSVLPDYPDTAAALLKVVKIAEIFIVTMIFSSIVSTLEDIYNTQEMSKLKPITSLVQVIKIVLYVIAVLVSIAYLLDTKISTIRLHQGFCRQHTAFGQ